MARAATPFNPRTVLLVLLVGAGAFLLFLYAIGQGWDGSDEQQGEAHAAANGLQGFSGLVDLARARGHTAEISRSEGDLDASGLLVLTPTPFTDGEDLTQIINDRRWIGPTLVILPKWFARRAAALPGQKEVPEGWVQLFGEFPATWLGEFDIADVRLRGRANDSDSENSATDIFISDGEEQEQKDRPKARYTGLGRAGELPTPDALWMESPDLLPLVLDSEGRMLAGYLDDGGYYGLLEDAYYGLPEMAGEASGAVVVNTESGTEDDEYYNDRSYPVVIVSEPDLFNNYGMAHEARAAVAMGVIEATLDGEDLPLTFDLTVPGYGSAQNLLTLAFAPPFLAATLCLLLAAAIIAWRAFMRYGPPQPGEEDAALGKTQLVGNGAALVERTRRFHLLGTPYAALMGERIARKLGVRETQEERRAQAIEAALARRAPGTSFIDAANAMRAATRPRELLRAARALKDIERTVTR